MNSDRRPAGAAEESGHDGAVSSRIFRNEKEFLDSLRDRLGDERYERVKESLRLGRHPRPLTAGERQILSETLAPLLRDLAATGMHLPDIRPEAHHDGELEGVRAWIREPGGGGSGIEIVTIYPPAERVAMLAEQLQNWAADQLHDAGRPPDWPVCPQHPAGGRAEPEVLNGSPVWICAQTGHVIIAIGSLHE